MPRTDHNLDCAIKLYPNRAVPCTCGFIPKPHESYMPLSKAQLARKTVQEVSAQNSELSFHGLLVKSLERLSGRDMPEEFEAAIGEVITRALQAGQEAGIKQGIKNEQDREKTNEEIYNQFKVSAQKEFKKRVQSARGALTALETLADTILQTSVLLGCRDPEVSEITSRVRNARAAVGSHMPWNNLDAQS